MSYDGPGTYRHYKGGRYEVIGLALREATVRKHDDPPFVCASCGHEYQEGEPARDVCAEADRVIFGCRLVENKSATGRTDVVYRRLTPGPILEGRQESFWTRSLKNFNAEVSIKTHGDGLVTRPRFEKVS